MKLGVVGPDESLLLVREVIEKDRIPIEMVPLQYRRYTEALAMVEQQQPSLDALFFTGTLPFRYVSRFVRPTVPWEHVPNNMLSVAYALIKAAFIEGADLSRISTDSYTRRMFLEAYQETGLDAENAVILCAADRIFSEDYIDYLVDYHCGCFRSGQVSCCFTGICEVRNRLSQQGIPAAMVQISYETIALQIHKLRMQCAENLPVPDGSDPRITVMAVALRYPEEHTIFGQNAIALLQQKNRIAEMIYAFAQAIGAAIVQDNEGRFLLFSSGSRLEIETDRFSRISLLDQLCELDLIEQAAIGIGAGDDCQQAKLCAETALRKAYSTRTSCAFLVRRQTVYGPIMPFSSRQGETPARQRLLEISARSGISLRSLEQIELAIRQYGMEYATPVQLSQISGINPRNLNRILQKLEDAGYLSVVGKESRVGMGRPGRIIKLHFIE